MDDYATVDEYIECAQTWPAEIEALRPILLQTGLDETIKWGKPCYVHDGANIAIVQEFNDFLALLFVKGALLDDPADVLEPQGPNTRSAMRICFRSVDDVKRLSDTVATYLAEAIAVEEAGLEVGPAPEPDYCDELIERLDRDEAFRTAFEGLTPGRRREYHLHFSGAKRSETRASRVGKAAEKILAGKGLRDR